MNPLNGIDPSNPAESIENLQRMAKGSMQLLGYAVGLTEDDVRNLYYGKIPLWAIVAGSAVLGAAAWSRWAPEHWIGRVRTFGR